MRTRPFVWMLAVAALSSGLATGQLGGGVGGGLGGGVNGGGLRGPAQAAALPPGKPILVGVGPVSVAEGEEVGGVVAIGPVSIAGRVLGDVTTIGGKVSLARTALVAGNVTAVCAPVEVAEGAKVAGEVHANEFPGLASMDVGWPGAPQGAVVVGNWKPTAGVARPALIVIGGDAVVPKGTKMEQVGVLGGDLTIEEGADVATACVLGGTLTRVGGKLKEADEVLAPFAVPLEPPAPPDAGADVRTTLSLARSTSALRAAVETQGPWCSHATFAVGTARFTVWLALDTRAVQRVPEPAETPTAGGGLGGGAGVARDEWGAGYVDDPQYVSRDKDPAFQRSTMIGAGVEIAVTATDDQQRTVKRTINIGVPHEALWLGGPSPFASVTQSEHPAGAGGKRQ